VLFKEALKTPQEFQEFYPFLAEWLQETLAKYSPSAQTIASRGFPRLPNYFAPITLETSKVVLVDQLPLPPLSSWGLTRFADFERGDFSGITFLDTFFVKKDQSRNEALHFHELIHIVQWRILGPERFLYLYADGLDRFGYRNNPLEVMAYGAEAQFVNSTTKFAAEELVAQGLKFIT